MKQHAKFSPSSFGRLMKCAAAFDMSRLYKEQGASPAAQEGTAAHWVAEQMLKAKGEPLSVGMPIPDMPTLTVTQDMIDGAIEYLNYVSSIYSGVGSSYLEETLSMPRLHDDAFGTPDLWFMQGQTLHVFDYKFGHGFVDEFENWQLLAYASGAISKAGVTPSSIVMHIVQPRAYSSRGTCRSWGVGYDEFSAYELRLRTQLHAIASGDKTATPGNHCKYCVGRHACTTLQNACYTMIDVAQNNDALNLPPAALGVELALLHRASKLIEYRISGLEEQAKHLIQSGRRVANYSLVSSSGRTTWACDDKEVLAFGQLFGLDLRQPKPITPTQAAKQLPIALPDSMTVTPSSISLKEDDPNESRRIFSS